MPEQVNRYGIPADNQPHTYDILPGTQPYRVETAPGQDNLVEFWVSAIPDVTQPRTFQLIGTGEPIPESPGHRAYWQGTTARSQVGNVWHLYELVEVTPDA